MAENYNSRPYVNTDAPYTDYQPAYGYGIEAFSRQPGRRFEEVEPELAEGWNGARGTSTLGWDDARHAARDAWGRLGEGRSNGR